MLSASFYFPFINTRRIVRRKRHLQFHGRSFYGSEAHRVAHALFQAIHTFRFHGRPPPPGCLCNRVSTLVAPGNRPRGRRQTNTPWLKRLSPASGIHTKAIPSFLSWATNGSKARNGRWHPQAPAGHSPLAVPPSCKKHPPCFGKPVSGGVRAS